MKGISHKKTFLILLLSLLFLLFTELNIMKINNILLASLVAMPLTILEVCAAGNASDKLKDTVIDKTIQAFEDGFNSLFTNTELTIEGRTAADPNFTLLTINPISELFSSAFLFKFADPTYTYNPSTHSFVLQSSCLGSSVYCGNSTTLTHILSGYTLSHPYIPPNNTQASTGLKYSVQDITVTLDEKYKIVPINKIANICQE